MPQSVTFGRFRFDASSRRLFENTHEVPLNPKALDVLAYLILHPHQIVSKDEILREVWGVTAVTDDALVQRILDIRKALHDNPKAPVFVRTHPKRGYEWIAAPADGLSIPAPSHDRTARWIGLAAVALLALGAVTWTLNRRASRTTELSVQRLTAMPGMEDYPAVERRGSRIVFASNEEGLSNLWLLDLRSGEKTMLTKGDTNDSEPDWSPDGRWLAFRSERGSGGLHFMAPEGSEIAAIAPYGHHPRWSPDSRRVLFHTEGSDGRFFIWDMATKSTAEVAVTKPTLMNRAFPVWSPDGRSIYFLAILRSGTHVDGGVTLGHQIWRVSASGGEAQLMSPGIGVVRDGGFDVSPDGSEAVYIGLDRSLWKLSLDGGKPRRLTLTTEEHQHPRYTAGGDILFSTVSSPDSLWLIPTKGGGKMERLTRDGALARAAALSPDGSLVAYITWAGERFEVWCVDMASRRSWRVSPPGGPSRTRPVWSKDGKVLLYTVLEGARREEWAAFLSDDRRHVVRELPAKVQLPVRNGQFEVAATGEVRDLRQEPGTIPSPNGGAVLRMVKDGWSMDGGKLLPLEGLNPSNPEWSADGRQLYFQVGQAGWFNIWSLPIDPAGAPAAVTNFKGSPYLLSDMNRDFAVHPLGLIVSLRENRSDLWLIK